MAPNSEDLRTVTSLMGWTEDRLVAELGQPAVVRQEAPAQIWQYRGQECVFDVVLYDDGDAFTVAYFEARDLEARKQPAEQCLSSIRAGRSGSLGG